MSMPGTKAQLAEILGRIPLFSACSKRELRHIASLTSALELSAGDVLTKQGQPGGEAFVIAEGRFDVKIGGKQVATLGEGEIVGEMALLDGEPRTATVQAATDGRVMVLDRREFATLLQDTPGVAVKMLKAVAKRLREAERPAVHH
jgi:CRP/FNR family cyclic AMP-dependent transcriptional regulator